jgi:hypothetical protein
LEERGSTEMNKLQAVIATSVLVVAIASGTIFGFSQTIVNDNVYNRMVNIIGHVEILNNPDLGRTAGSGEYLVFQREGCRNCLIGTYADANGNYKIRVGRGRYRLIVYNPSPPTYDMIAPDQPRYVNATSILRDNVFDIKLVVPTRR